MVEIIIGTSLYEEKEQGIEDGVAKNCQQVKATAFLGKKGQCDMYCFTVVIHRI